VAMTEADDSQLASTAGAPVNRALLNHGLVVSAPDPQADPKMDQRYVRSSEAGIAELDWDFVADRAVRSLLAKPRIFAARRRGS
jgi:hypothetical protein